MSSNPCVEFDGLRFYRSGTNPYYWCKHWPVRGRTRSLHKHVWEHHHGPVPPGMVVHHEVRDYATTDVAHLMLMTASAHMRLHNRERKMTVSPQAREAAIAWHRSAEGRAWHAENSRHAWRKRPKVPLTCTHCGKAYWGYLQARKRGFCGQNCQNKARRVRLRDGWT